MIAAYPGSKGKPNQEPHCGYKTGEQRDIEHRLDQAGNRVSFLPAFHSGSLRAPGFDREGIVCKWAESLAFIQIQRITGWVVSDMPQN